VAGRVRIGCSGFMYDSWKDGFYEGVPRKRWLERYAEEFETVELNTTFYRLPKPATVADWVRRTPDGFTFAAKASRYLTHLKRLREMDASLDLYYESIGPLVESPKLGPIVWQFPANFHRDDERLAAALETLERHPAGRRCRHCFEFRHESWFSDPVYELLSRHDAALVIGDHPKWPFQARVLTTEWTLVRFHHGRRGRRGNYSEREIAEWAELIDSWPSKTEVFAYFNNDWEQFAIANARTLRRMVTS
jgi:uncharacterized protein YecE (DUF72 family)